MTNCSKDAEHLAMLPQKFWQIDRTGHKQTYSHAVLYFTYCNLKRLTGRVPFYGKSLKDIVKKNTEASVNFNILKKENFSKTSTLKSH